MHSTRPRDDGPIVTLIQIGERRNLFPAIGKSGHVSRSKEGPDRPLVRDIGRPGRRVPHLAAPERLGAVHEGIDDLDAEIDEAKQLFEIAQLKNNEYLTIRSLIADPSDKGKEEYLKQIQAEIKNLQREEDKAKTDRVSVNGSGKSEPETDKEIVAPGKTSDITLQPEDPDGKAQAPTGVSLTDESGEVRQRK